MDYLQYRNLNVNVNKGGISFKPCYKWITFNTVTTMGEDLIKSALGFKPCYKWITFNTGKVIGFDGLYILRF